ncbi:MAG: ATP-dependent DNA helicase RecG [Candidatus Binatia bacterium]
MGDPAHSPAGDTLASFVSAVQRPLEFLSAGGPVAAARTQVAGRALAARGLALRGRVRGERRRALEALCERLAAFDDAAPPVRARLAEECRRLLADVHGTAAADRPISYRPSTGELASAWTELTKSVQYVHGVGPHRAGLLRKLGIATVEDLLYHLPFRYEDRRRLSDIASARVGEDVSLVGELMQIAERTVGRGRRRILEGVLRDATGLLGLTWYNRVVYFRHRFRAGQRLLVYGKIELTPAGGKRITHPEIEADPDADTGSGILPVYEKPTSMSVAAMRRICAQAAAKHADAVPCVLPTAVAARAGVADPATALRMLHAPGPDDDVDQLNRFASPAHRALVFDELFFLQLGLGLKRRQTARERGIPLPRTGRLTDAAAARLPFALTGAQQRVIGEIYADLARPHPMHRLVQGDVGSGKTIVALFAALAAIEQGAQAAVMAPTELLAEQHFATMSALLDSIGVRSALLTSDVLRTKRASVYGALEQGEIDLAVGTHALLQAGVRMPHLGLGVIDEQHRFGVLQRAGLGQLRGDADGPLPHILLMTATPIPRTLAMTLYSDLDVSLLDELPPGRTPVRTEIVNEAARRSLYDRIAAELQHGHQAYIVHPLVEASEKQDLRDATSMARELGRTVFAGYRVGLLHGRMKAEEKDAIMRRFRAGDLQVLFSTTVIEVGVDVPNATVMVVEHAERFGLSQLHQLRGRVGRGSAEAVCFLVAPYIADRQSDILTRLKAMKNTTDGFTIAEVDLSLRGPGDFLGTRQHGLPDFRVANLIRDSRLVAAAREAAESWLTLDPQLSTSDSAALRIVLERRWKGRLALAEIG